MSIIDEVDIPKIINDVKKDLVELFAECVNTHALETSTTAEQPVSEPSKLPSGHRWLFQ